MVIYHGTDGMQVPNSTYKLQHAIPLGKLSKNCLMFYGGGTTPLKQETYALCVPSFMFSCLSDCTLFQMKNEHSTSDHPSIFIPAASWNFVNRMTTHQEQLPSSQWEVHHCVTKSQWVHVYLSRGNKPKMKCRTQ